MRIFKRLAGVSYKDRMTNEEVLSRPGVERGLLSQVRTHKLSYFGHIARHGSLQTTVLTGRIDGRRGRGRPRRQRYVDIKEWTGNQLYTSIKLAQDLEKRGKSTPEWPERTKTTTTTTTTATTTTTKTTTTTTTT